MGLSLEAYFGAKNEMAYDTKKGTGDLVIYSTGLLIRN